MDIRVGMLPWPQATSWADLRDAVCRADSLGYDSVWLWDHLLSIEGGPDQPIFEGWTTLAAWGALTSRVRLGLLVGANTLRNPGLVAKMAATVDHISGGRAIVGMGAAWNEIEHTSHGIDFGSGFGQRMDWLDQSLSVIRGLLDGRTVNLESDHYAFRDARQFPQPVQEHLPILVGANGEKKGLGIVARYADMWNTMGPLDLVRHRDEVLREHCVAIGRDPDTIERTLEFKTLIRSDQREADRLWDLAIRHNNSLPERVRNAWVGPPEAVAERMRSYIEAGFRTFIVEMPAPYDPETIERLMGEVVPLAAS
jgi:alkanesulfonate monooxygenase SsuD/methylene tetrahydromethanopterin reductase-like flavin-dependent oxidoreductase (luciferase family)